MMLRLYPSIFMVHIDGLFNLIFVDLFQHCSEQSIERKFRVKKHRPQITKLADLFKTKRGHAFERLISQQPRDRFTCGIFGGVTSYLLQTTGQ